MGSRGGGAVVVVPFTPGISDSMRTARLALMRTAGSHWSSPSRTGWSGPALSAGRRSLVVFMPSAASSSVAEYGGRPSTAKYRLAPNDHRSPAGVAGRPRSRSGAM